MLQNLFSTCGKLFDDALNDSPVKTYPKTPVGNKVIFKTCQAMQKTTIIILHIKGRVEAFPFVAD